VIVASSGVEGSTVATMTTVNAAPASSSPRK